VLSLLCPLWILVYTYSLYSGYVCGYGYPWISMNMDIHGYPQKICGYGSHTRTVVRECCKGDDQSQWRRANFNPPPPLSPLTDLHQNWQRWLRRGYLPPCKILFRSDKGFRFRACATSRTIGDSAIFFWVLEITYSQDATTDIDAKYVIRRGSVQGCAFWGSENHTLTSTPPFSPKTAILGPDYDGT